MNRNAVLGAVVFAAALTTGCVDRKFVVTSDPPNAAVYRNGTYIGQTPVDDAFIYYGKYEFRIVKEGYETVVEQKRISAPWYEIPPLDFITDNFGPNIRDVRRLNYTLPERIVPREPEVLDRAQALQKQASTIGSPAADGTVPGTRIAPVPALPGPATPATVPTTPPAPPPGAAPPAPFPVAPLAR